MSNWPLRMSLVTVLLSMTSSWMVTPRFVLHWSERNWFSVLLAVELRVSSFIFERSAVLPESASSFLAAAGSKLCALSEMSYPFIPLGMNVSRDLPLPCSMSLTSLSRSIDLDSAMRTFLSLSGDLVVGDRLQVRRSCPVVWVGHQRHVVLGRDLTDLVRPVADDGRRVVGPCF